LYGLIKQDFVDQAFRVYNHVTQFVGWQFVFDAQTVHTTATDVEMLHHIFGGVPLFIAGHSGINEKLVVNRDQRWGG